jgi:hypothetical protein
MARTLNVYFDREIVGKLTQDDGGQMIFQYGESWLALGRARGAVPLPAAARRTVFAKGVPGLFCSSIFRNASTVGCHSPSIARAPASA